MHQNSTVVALMAVALDSALAGDVDAALFGPYLMGNVECKQVMTRYALYVPSPLGQPYPWPGIDSTPGVEPGKRGDC